MHGEHHKQPNYYLSFLHHWFLSKVLLLTRIKLERAHFRAVFHLIESPAILTVHLFETPAQCRILKQFLDVCRECAGTTSFFPSADDIENSILLRAAFHILLAHFKAICSSIAHSSGFDVLILLNCRIGSDGCCSPPNSSVFSGIRLFILIYQNLQFYVELAGGNKGVSIPRDR